MLKLSKKITGNVPFFVLYFFVILLTIINIVFIVGISEISMYKNIYEKGIDATAEIIKYSESGNVPNTRFLLKYRYVDNNGAIYEGNWKSVLNNAEAKSLIGTEIQIKIYKGMSCPADIKPNPTPNIIAVSIVSVVELICIYLIIIKYLINKKEKTKCIRNHI